MIDVNVDRIVEDLLVVLPLLHKKLLKMNLDGVNGKFTRLHFAIMRILSEHSITVSQLASILVMQRSQMTSLIEQLVELGVVERNIDRSDRRVIHLTLTGKGRLMFDELKLQVRDNIKSDLTSLTPEELSEMSRALEILRSIGAKL